MITALENRVSSLSVIVYALVAAALVFCFADMAFAQSGFIQATDNPASIGEATGNEGSFRAILLTIVNFILGFLGLLAVIMIIYGGFLYVTAGASKDGAEKGKSIITYAAIGIVVILISFALVNTILGAAAPAGEQQ